MTAHSGPPAATAGEEASGGPWYRRRAWLVSGALVAVVAVAVIADRPQHSSRPGQISADSRVMSQVNADVGPCSQALSKSFTILGDLTAHTLTPSQVNEVPGRLRHDQAACSLVDASIYQLSTIDVPSSASGRDVGRVVSTVTLWATSDAVSAIEQIQALSPTPPTAPPGHSWAMTSSSSPMIAPWPSPSWGPLEPSSRRSCRPSVSPRCRRPLPRPCPGRRPGPARAGTA